MQKALLKRFYLNGHIITLRTQKLEQSCMDLV